MTPFATSHSSNHNPGPICFGMLHDIGWNLDFSGVNNTDENSEIKIFPNPSIDILNLKSEMLKSATISVYDLAGRKIFSAQTN